MRASQYANWVDFSTRMAARAELGLRARPDRGWVIDLVASILSEFEDPKCYGLIVDWDNSKSALCVSDCMDSWESDEMPYFRGMLERREDERILDLDASVNPNWVEHITEIAEAQWSQQWWSPIACCIRAGLDMATRIGGGVLGFTVGDLRRMYPEGLPRFVKRHYGGALARRSDAEPLWL